MCVVLTVETFKVLLPKIDHEDEAVQAMFERLRCFGSVVWEHHQHRVDALSDLNGFYDRVLAALEKGESYVSEVERFLEQSKLHDEQRLAFDNVLKEVVAGLVAHQRTFRTHIPADETDRKNVSDSIICLPGHHLSAFAASLILLN